MIDTGGQKRKADDFLALHHAPTNFILPNAWDVASAKIFELEGFKAIGTTSAGIAATLGYADGQHMSLAENMEVVRRIVNNTSLPVSADIEAGYAISIEGVVKASGAVLDVGAVHHLCRSKSVVYTRKKKRYLTGAEHPFPADFAALRKAADAHRSVAPDYREADPDNETPVVGESSY